MVLSCPIELLKEGMESRLVPSEYNPPGVILWSDGNPLEGMSRTQHMSYFGGPYHVIVVCRGDKSSLSR